ncbi:MAG: DUF488 domain-containing protein [Methanomassiliicoccales archaeon]|nr:DUF488 domain-containing protein [Methanomassiliicoccales archaeon]
MHRGTLRMKRVYEAPSPEDGMRVLVDRLWPRGLSREKAAVDRWMKEIAPSDGLRHWYSHDREKYDEFRRRYRAELDSNGTAVGELLSAASSGPVTLLYSSSSPDINNAVVLLEYIRERMRNK